MSKSMARSIVSISRRTARAFRWCACTRLARTEGSGGICWRTRSLRRTFASSPSTCPGTANRIRRRAGPVRNIGSPPRAIRETIRAFCKALALEKPVVMGCSIGGRIVLNLAIDHAAEFRALIGLEAADFQAPWYDTDLAEPSRRPWRRSLRRAGVRPDRAAKSGSSRAAKRCGPTSRAVPASSRAICISIGWTATCAAGSRRSILKYVRFIC